MDSSSTKRCTLMLIEHDVIMEIVMFVFFFFLKRCGDAFGVCVKLCYERWWSEGGKENETRIECLKEGGDKMKLLPSKDFRTNDVSNKKKTIKERRNYRGGKTHQ